jgi:[protein-PII] uridylyltransferase
MTAQKQDIGDPQVINDFAQRAGETTLTIFMYSPAPTWYQPLWNSWKASLFRLL